MSAGCHLRRGARLTQTPPRAACGGRAPKPSLTATPQAARLLQATGANSNIPFTVTVRRSPQRVCWKRKSQRCCRSTGRSSSDRSTERSRWLAAVRYTKCLGYD